MIVSKDLLEKMDSADHFKKEVPLSMTELVEILESAHDTIFKVQFKKQVKEDDVEKVLKDLSPADVKKEAKKKEVVKLLTEGETSTLICYLVELQTILGRSTVIDLSAKTESKFR